MSTSLAEQADTQTAHSDGDDWVVHGVNFYEWVVGDLLRLRVPRSLCGASLKGDPDEPEPGFNAPRCPKCEAARG